jgi:hypothetical protein
MLEMLHALPLDVWYLVTETRYYSMDNEFRDNICNPSNTPVPASQPSRTQPLIYFDQLLILISMGINKGAPS